MAFKDGLQDLATFYTISLTTSSKGQQKKGEVALYTNVPCRISLTSNSSYLGDSIKASETPTDKFTILVEAEYGGATRGDRVVINSEKYLIIKKIGIKGSKSSVEFYNYILEKE